MVFPSPSENTKSAPPRSARWKRFEKSVYAKKTDASCLHGLAKLLQAHHPFLVKHSNFHRMNDTRNGSGKQDSTRCRCSFFYAQGGEVVTICGRVEECGAVGNGQERCLQRDGGVVLTRNGPPHQSATLTASPQGEASLGCHPPGPGPAGPGRFKGDTGVQRVHLRWANVPVQ